MKEKEMYISDDGCLFDTKEECMDYEKIISACEELIGGHIVTEEELMELQDGDYIFHVGGKWADFENKWDYFNAGPVQIKHIKKIYDAQWYIIIYLSDGTESEVNVLNLFVTPQTTLQNIKRHDEEKFLAKIQAKSCIYSKDKPTMRYAAAIDYIQSKRTIRDRIQINKEVIK